MHKYKIRCYLYDGYIDSKKTFTDKGETQWEAIAMNIKKDKPEGFIKAEVAETKEKEK